MRFTHAHTPAAFCSPTRYSMLTGNYAWRGRTPNGTWGFDVPGQILPGQKTVANLLKEAGYRTAMFGKQGFGGEHARKADGTADFTRPMIDGPKSWGDRLFGHHPARASGGTVFFPRERIAGMRGGETRSRKGGVPRSGRQRRKPPEGRGLFGAGLGPRQGGRTSPRSRTEVSRLAFRPEKTCAVLHALLRGWHHWPYAPAESLAERKLRGETGMTDHTDMVLETDILLSAMMEMLEERGLLNDTLICFTSDNGGIPLERSFGHDAVGGCAGRKASSLRVGTGCHSCCAGREKSPPERQAIKWSALMTSWPPPWIWPA